MSGSYDNTLRTYDVEGNILNVFTGHTDWVSVWLVVVFVLLCLNVFAQVNDCAFSGNGEHIVSASNDETAVVWDTASAAKLCDLRHPKGVSVFFLVDIFV